MNKDTGILFFRVTLGTLMVMHAVMKIVGGVEFLQNLGSLPPFIPEDERIHLALGVVATTFEGIGGLGVITGFRFRTACLLIVMVMIPAFLYHLGSVTDFTSFMRNSWPLEIGCVFSAFILIGPGRYSLGWKP